MLNHDQLTPEETDEQNQPLILDLQRYYTTHAEDQASQARIRARLLGQRETAAPDAAASRLPSAALPVPTHTARNPGLTMLPLLMWERPRRPYLTALVAAVLLVALVGSLTFFLNRQQVANQPPPAPQHIIAHGWTLVEQLRGTGSLVYFLGQNIERGQKYGWSIICTNNSGAQVSVVFNESANDQGRITCAGADTSATTYPEMSYSAATPFAPIAIIDIATEATISWQFLLFTGIYHPPLAIPAGWQPLIQELDGSNSELYGGPFPLALPQTWGLLFNCHGVGTIEITIQTGYGSGISNLSSNKAQCDGQSNFDTSTGVDPGVQVSQIEITTRDENDWQLILVGCASGNSACAPTTSSVP